MVLKDYMSKYNINEDIEKIADAIEMKHRNAKPDYELIFKRYQQYSMAYGLLTFGKDPKYISASDTMFTLYGFINRALYNEEHPLPKTPLTEYLFDDMDFYDIVDRFNEIDNNIKKQRAESIKKHNYGRFIV